jgi:hypothetical protein
MTDCCPKEYLAAPLSEKILPGRYATHAVLVCRK